MRPLFTVPIRKLHPSAKLTLDQLALVETLGIGCHAVNRSNLQPNETALVIGAGPIGLSTLQFVKLAGARAIVLDINPRRLEFCQHSMGADHVVQSSGSGDGSQLKALQELTDGILPTVVIDATGSNQSMSNALQYVAFTGRLVFVGITTNEIAFGQPLMHRRELTLLASRNALPGDFTRIIRLIEEGRIDTRPWITHRSGFDDLIENFPSYTKPETGVIKAVLEIG
jgi:alcohol dehydrogenase